MKNVQPIRDKDQIEMLKDYLKEWNPRNFLLLVFGLNSGLRISDILPLKVKREANSREKKGKNSQLVESMLGRF